MLMKYEVFFLSHSLQMGVTQLHTLHSSRIKACTLLSALGKICVGVKMTPSNTGMHCRVGYVIISIFKIE